jgi:hypothetical protein
MQFASDSTAETRRGWTRGDAARSWLKVLQHGHTARGCLRLSEKRRQAAAVQNASAVAASYGGRAGAIHSAPVESTSAFARKLWRDEQVVEIFLKGWLFAMQLVDFPRVADELQILRVCGWLSGIYNLIRKSLIFRDLPPFSAIFRPFLTCKGVDLPSVTEKTPDFFAGETVSISDCVPLRSGASAGQGFSETSASPSTGSGRGSVEPCGLGKTPGGGYGLFTRDWRRIYPSGKDAGMLESGG